MWKWRSEPSHILKPQIPQGTRVYVVGDVHGCVELLDALHEKIRNDLKGTQVGRNQIVYLGDYIDRGPKSADVIERLVSNPIENLPAIHLKGNHEAIMTAFLERPEQMGPKWFAIGGAATVVSYGLPWRGGEELPKLAEDLKTRLPDSHRAFLATLATRHSVGDYLFVHAGVRPGVPIARQTESDLLWIREKFLGSKNDHGSVVVHGHTPVPHPEEFPNRIAIDTGAYYTGTLTCLVLEGARRRYLAAHE